MVGGTDKRMMESKSCEGSGDICSEQKEVMFGSWSGWNMMLSSVCLVSSVKSATFFDFTDALSTVGQVPEENINDRLTLIDLDGPNILKAG